MIRLKVLGGILLGVAAVWALAYTNRPRMMPADPQSDKKTPAPDIGIRAKTGDLHLSSLKGHVVLVDFWATWCGPCRMSMPAIEGLYKKFHSQGFDVMGVAMERDMGSGIADAVKEAGVTYPVGLPMSRDEVMAYNPSSIPFMVLVDRKGVARFSQEGYGPGLEDQIAASIEKLLAEQ